MLRPVAQPQAAELAEPSVSLAGGPAPEGQESDQYLAKLAKYVPGEVTAFYIGAYGLADSNAGRCVILIIGVLATPMWAFAFSARRLAAYFYLLSAAAFLAWAIGTSDVGNQLVGLGQSSARLILVSAAFGIPLVDEVLTKALVRRRGA
jgi:hypothetical protein